MSTAYPGALDTTTTLPPKAQLTGKLLDGSDSAGVADHDDVHDVVHSAIIAIETLLGINGANFQPIDSDLTAIAALTTTAFGRAFLVLADAAAAIAALGLDADLATFSLPASTTITAFAATVLDDTTQAAAQTTLGLGTGDTPTFTAVNVGAADTTLAREGAGDITVEGNHVYRAGGTDVPVTDGGTGVSTLTNHGVVLGQGTSAVAVTAAGTSGQVLVSGGASADPSYKSIASADSSVTVTAGSTIDLSVSGVSLLAIVERQQFK